ncbi:MAG: type-F conjugative transfer system protein TraW [Pseudomonadota bacterium]
MRSRCFDHTRLAAALVLCACAALAPAWAWAATGHLGVIGPVYPIAEEDFLKYIERKLQEAKRSGKLDALGKTMRDKTRERLETLPPLAGVRTTTEPRSFTFDPSITLPQDIRTPEGQVLAAAGTRINPLDTVSMTKRLLFFDGRDPRQRRLASQLIAEHGMRLKPVLVAGDFMPLSRDWQTPVYYDQAGLLTARFGIEQVPALVYQDGGRLRIDEMLP